MKILISIFLWSLTAIGAETSQIPERKFPESRWPEVYSLIDSIKSQNPPVNVRTTLKFGVIQMQTNTTEVLGESLPCAGFEGSANIFRGFGIEAKYIYAQGSIANITWLNFGPKYTFYFDSTQLDDFLALKVLYHQNASSIIVPEPSTTTGAVSTSNTPFFVTSYTGTLLGVERGIPITKKLGVLASFDLLLIQDASYPKTNLGWAIKNSGYGFQLQGELYYKFLLFSKNMRFGVSYWQQGNDTEFDRTNFAAGAPDANKHSYFQLARTIFFNLSTSF